MPLKAFLGDFSKVPSIKETLQQLMMNCNNRFFFKPSKHAYLAFFLRASTRSMMS